MKLKISARASVLELAAGKRHVTEVARLAALDCAGSDECFSDYLVDGSSTKVLPSKGVTGGYLRFRFRSEIGELWAETEYDLRERLGDEEFEALVDYTLGQWSDGIGENFCPAYAEQTGLSLAIHIEDATSQIID